MKKLLIIITLTVWNTGIYAQKVFDEAVFNGMMSRMQTDPAFFKNEVDPSFIITFGNGATTNQESMLKYAENNIGLYKPKYSNLKVSQYGNTGIVTGTNEETFLSKANPSIVTRTSKHLFTYTFAKIKKNWIWVAGQHTESPNPFTKETLNEILAEYKTDSKEFMNSHLSEDWRYINSKGGYQARKDFIGGTKQSIVTTEMLNPVIFQSGNLAVTSGIHQTTRTTSDGKKETSQVGATYTWQNRNGKWMFVGSQQIPVAPSNFDEATFKGIMGAWEKDPKNFFTSEIDPKALFTNGNGELMTQAQLAAAFGNGMSLNQKKVEDLIVYQSGNTGVATGKTFENYNNGEYLYTGKFTYTFSQQNGKWVIASAQHTNFRSPKEEDEAAIKSTIEGETNAFKMNDANKTTSFWLNTPYTSHHYTAKGLGYVRGEKVGSTITDYLKANPKIDNSPTNYHDYIIRINGNSAWATYISDDTSNGKKVVYNKAAYLEKTNGEWKMGSVNSVEAK